MSRSYIFRGLIRTGLLVSFSESAAQKESPFMKLFD